MMKAFLLFLGLLVAKQKTVGAASCSFPHAPENGLISCPNGVNHFSVCIISCQPGYKVSGPSRTVCWCRGNDCSWKGKEAVCERADCNVPFHDTGRVVLADQWPGGFGGVAVLDDIPSSADIKDGWSVVIVFDRPLGKNVSVTSWNVELSTSSYDGQTYTLTNLRHNTDLSKLLQSNSGLSILFVMNNVDGEMPKAAYVGLFDSRIQDATCVFAPKMPAIVNVGTEPSKRTEVVTVAPETAATVATMATKKPPTKIKRPGRPGKRRKPPIKPRKPAKKPPVKTTTPPLVTETRRTESTQPKVVVTSPPTTSPKTKVAVTKPPPVYTTKKVATAPTTKKMTTVITTTAPTVAIPDKGRYCILQREPDHYSIKKSWVDRGNYSFSINAVMEVTQQLKDWSMVIVFDTAVLDIEVWTCRIIDFSADKLIWTFGPHEYDEGLNQGKTNVNFIAKKVEKTSKPPLGQVYLCSNSFTSGDALMMRPADGSSPQAQYDDAFRAQPPPAEAIVKKKASKKPKPSADKRCQKTSPSGSQAAGTGQTTPQFSPNTDGTKYNYNEVLHKSLLFYEAQRSGELPPDNRIPWRGNSGLKDGCDIGVDASGGWYDSGGMVKYNFPMAFTLTTLAWGGIEFRDAYEDAGELKHMMNAIKWGTRYFIKCHTSKYELIGQVGKSETESSNWVRPEEMSYARPTYKITANKPGTELAAEAAAALAAASIFLKSADADLADNALKHAKELFDFADKYRKMYHLSIPDVIPAYKSYSGFDDELVWAAAWLYKATKQPLYLNSASKTYTRISGQYSIEDRYAWDRKLVGAQALLTELTGKEIYRSPLTQYLDGLEVATTTPKGMYFLDEWGPNRYTAGAAFMAVIGAKLNLPEKESYLRWATKQIGLILGDTGRSFVIGFGKNYPKMTQHRASSCPPAPQICDWSAYNSDQPNHYILYGALVGGTNEDGVFHDDRENQKENHVACDYNAAFQSAVAGLKHFAMKSRGSRPKPEPVHPTRPSAAPPTRQPAVYTQTQRETSPASKYTSYTTTQKSVYTTRTPYISEKVRCASSSPSGRPVRNAPQTPLNFKPNNDGTKHNYNEVLHKSILFFEVQRSGRLPPDNRIPWRGDSGLKDGCDIGKDLTGGWYDAGDFVKFNFPMAFSLTTLAWGGIAFRKAYEDAGEMQHMISAVKWPTEYFIKCHISKNVLVGQVGHGKTDHDSWGRPETMSMKRPTYKLTTKKPGTELAAETAAALAAASIFLKESHPQLASEALRHAKEIYQFADDYRGLYHKSIPDAKTYYESISGYDDELIWGAAWLYKATRDKKYLKKAADNYNRIQGKYVVETRYSWDRKLCGAQALLAELTGEAIYRDPFLSFLDNLPRAQKTPQGLHFITKWGSNRYAAGAAFMSALGAALKPAPPRKVAYQKWAEKQIGLMLGDAGPGYVVGYGKRYPTKPHHRSSTCPPYPRLCDWSVFHSPAKNYYTLYGALVGGPDAKGVYHNRRELYEETEVTTDYNACFQSAVAGVKNYAMESRGKVGPTRATKPTKATPKTTPKKPTPMPKTSPKAKSPRPYGKDNTGVGKKGKGKGKKGKGGGKVPCTPPNSFKCKQKAKKGKGGGGRQ